MDGPLEDKEEGQKAKEVETPAAAEKNLIKSSVAYKFVRHGVNSLLGKQQQKQPQQQKHHHQQQPNLVSIEKDGEKSASAAADEYQYEPKAVVSSSSYSLVPYRGLHNQGLTSGLNSVLQILFMTPQFRQMIIREFAKLQPYYTAKTNDELYVELGKLFEILQNDEGELACSTEGFTKALGWTRRETGQQCDAHTVFRDILTALQGQTSSSRYKQIDDIFHTELEDWTQCMECGKEEKQVQKISSLAVPIQGHTSVEGCLRSFFKIHEISGFLCQKCGKVVTAKEKWQYRKVAPIIVVNLKRFQLDGLRIVKLNDSLSFKTVLFYNPQNIYALYAVICHSGGTFDGGHYYASIRDPLQDQWFEFNDSMVHPCPLRHENYIQTIAGHRNYEYDSSSAYILFYKKVGPIMASAAEGSSV